MKGIGAWLQSWFVDSWSAWDRFWFSAVPPHTLAAIRILAGTMLFYTHLVWSLDLMAFLGPHSWLPGSVVREMYRASGSYAWSYLWYVESPVLLWCLHFGALVVFALMTIGLYTRVVSVLAAVITLAYCHRLPGALFGLDQINALLAMYVAIGPSGAVYSVDQWLATRRAGQGRGGVRRTGSLPHTSVAANIAIRLIQLHLCVVYLFGGIGKMRGEMWWDGSAVWYAIANYEYQSWDMTWLVRLPWLIALLTHVTVFWETFYAFLVWSPRWRPVMLIMAVAVHGGIVLFLGMPTFGLAMIIANLAFVRPEFVERVVRLKPGSLKPEPRIQPA